MVRPREELVRVRAGAWHLLVPMRYVERVHGAALPAARPATAEPAAPVVSLGGQLVPVVFAAALLGAEEVRLVPEQQMVLLAACARRALLWVDAVEEVVEHAPAAAPPGRADRDGLVACWSHDGRPLAVLDVPKVLELAAGQGEWKETT
jgi:chemotaxis signal transduction protein